MGTDNIHGISDATSEFERSLERLVLGSFTKGVPVDGTWEITVPLADAPDWMVTIEREYSGDVPSYQPELLEE
jgi:hypothetical protein